jgi:hypothetical protein
MFYVNLGNLGLYTTNGASPQPGYGLANSGPFQNLQDGPYWSDTQSINQPTAAWYFDFAYGTLAPGDISGVLNNQFHAWAVRDGDVTNVPEPSIISFLAPLLLGLGWAGRRWRLWLP